jgi:hypothetical protein
VIGVVFLITRRLLASSDAVTDKSTPGLTGARTPTGIHRNAHLALRSLTTQTAKLQTPTVKAGLPLAAMALPLRTMPQLVAIELARGMAR